MALEVVAESLAVHHCPLWLSHNHCQKYLQSVKVQQQHDKPTKMAGVPSLQSGLGQVWQDAIVGLIVGTSISHSMLCESSRSGSHADQSGRL